MKKTFKTGGTAFFTALLFNSAHAGIATSALEMATPSTADIKAKAAAACQRYAKEAEIAASAGISNPRPLRTKACAMWANKKKGS